MKDSSFIKTFKSAKSMKTKGKIRNIKVPATDTPIKNQSTYQLGKVESVILNNTNSNNSKSLFNKIDQQEATDLAMNNSVNLQNSDLNSINTLPLVQQKAFMKQKTSLFASESNANVNSNGNTFALINQDANRNANIRVFGRFRPMNDVEIDLMNNGIGSECVEYVSKTTIQIKHPNGGISNPYILDHVFSSNTAQKELYDLIGKDIVKDVVSGYNGTIFAYGQSGSGKTFTMYGDNTDNIETMGIIPRIISEIFDFVDKCNDNITFQFKMSFMQIYKEVIYDLLTGDKDLKIKENPIRGIYADKLTEVYVNSMQNFMEYVDLAQENRIVSETKLNSYSSRSHSILIFEVNQTLVNENLTKKGILNLVDLAGSEKISKTGAVGETLEEAKKINLSLSALGNVIHALTSNADHIPYRNSKLTRILQESLGGNYKTNIIVTCSPHSYHLEESTSSLQFAQRAKKIKNKVKVNIKLSYEELQKIVEQLKKLLKKEKKENEKLRLKLLSYGETIPNQGLKKSLEEEKVINKKTTKLIHQDEGTTLLSMTNTDNDKESIGDCQWIHETSLIPDISQIKSQSYKDINDCEEHMKIIKKLNDKLSKLTEESKEKEEIIKTLEESNFQKENQLQKPKPKSTSIFFSEPNDDNGNKNNTNAISHSSNNEHVKHQYTEPTNNNLSMHTKLINLINAKQQLYNDTIDNATINTNYHRKFHDMEVNLAQLCTQTYVNNQPNNYADLINSANALLSNTLHANNNTPVTAEYKQSIKPVFDDMLRQLSECNNTDRNIKPLTSMYMFTFLDSYVNIRMLNKMNEDMKLQNDNLIKVNQALFDIVKELLESNLKLNQKYNKQSFQLFDQNGTNNNIPNGIVDKTSENPNLSQMFNRRQNRITTSINKRGLQLINKLQVTRDNNTNNLNQYNQSLIEVTPNIIQDNMNTNMNRIITKPIEEIAYLNHQYEKEQEMKMNKINILQDIIITSFKQNEKYNKGLEDLKNNYSVVIEEATKKVYDNMAINKQDKCNVREIENKIDLSRNKRARLDISNESKENTINSNKNTHSIIDKSINSKKKRRTPEHVRLQTLNSISNQDRFEIQVPMKRNMTLDHISPASNQHQQKGIEELLTDYVQTGTATRRFDGISVKVVNKLIKCMFSSGLNARTSIQYAPVKSKLQQAVGDSNKSVYPEDEPMLRSSLAKKK